MKEENEGREKRNEHRTVWNHSTYSIIKPLKATKKHISGKQKCKIAKGQIKISTF